MKWRAFGIFEQLIITQLLTVGVILGPTVSIFLVKKFRIQMKNRIEIQDS